MTQMAGWGGEHSYAPTSYVNNRNQSFLYDSSGNVLNDGGQSYTYDAAGRQITSSLGLTNSYDGDGLRGKKIDSGTTTYYVRSSVLGGQVISELNGAGSVQRGYVYSGDQLLAIQGSGAVQWVHQEPFSKGQRLTDSSGNLVATVELDPWGSDTSRNSNQAFQPHRFTTYERDSTKSDDAMARRYNRFWYKFDQPDPYEGSNDVTNPQSLNRYTYTQNDPVNFVDPSGLECWASYLVTETTNSRGEVVKRTWQFLGIHCNPNSTAPASPIKFFDGTFRGSGITQKIVQKKPTVEQLLKQGEDWDKFNKWNACAHSIWEDYHEKRDSYLGQQKKYEVFASIAGATGGAAATGGLAAIPALLPAVIQSYREVDELGNQNAEYERKVLKTCGAQPPHP